MSGDGTNKIYVPYVGVIRDGKVVDFMLSFDYDAHTVQITEEQIEEYKKLLNALFRQINSGYPEFCFMAL